MEEHVHDRNGGTSSQTQTAGGVTYDVTATYCSCGVLMDGSATPR